MKYLVTGATGFVGGRLARQLREAGHDVTAVVRTPSKAEGLAALGVTVCAGDVTDKESLRAPMTGVDGVFHVAGWYKLGVRDKREAEPINVQGTRNVLELMRDLHVPKGVYTSTLAIFSDTHGQLVDERYRFTGRHLSVYDRTKADAHRVADEFIALGLPLVIVQPGLIYGPDDTSSLRTTLIQYLQGRQAFAPQGTGFCWAHVDDVALGHRLAMDKGRPGETYIIAGPPHRLTEFFDLAQSITGVPAPRLRPPAGMVRATAALMGVLEKVLPVPEALSAEYLRVNAGTTYWGDNGKARRELGYNPRSLREGMTETLRHEMRLLGMKAPTTDQ
jgi:nucleoside-diphosphate-sugar epimerase